VTAKDTLVTLSPVFRECLKHLLDICICDSLHSRFKCSSRNKSADGALRQRWSALNEQHFKKFMKTKSTLGPLVF
jgi:hypothetical protein